MESGGSTTHALPADVEVVRVDDTQSATEGSHPPPTEPTPEEEEEVRQSTKKASRQCCICGERSIYSCPGCNRRTCSMTCVRVHKKDFDCTGNVDVLKKVELNEFTDVMLQRDYRFLEDCRRVVSNAERALPPPSPYNFRSLPPQLRALREAAKKRGVVCQITSEGMAKREANTSRFDRATSSIMWHCEFRFHHHMTEEDANHGFADSALAAGSSTTTDDSSIQNNFIISTCWGCERYHLGDVLRYCWATNPPLPVFPIIQAYNVAKRARTEEKEGDVAQAVEVPPVASTSATALANPAEGDHPATPAGIHSEEDVNEEEEEEEEENSHSDDEPPCVSTSVVVLPAEDDVASALISTGQPRMTKDIIISPRSDEEARHAALVNAFVLAEPDFVVLCRAERLGRDVRYFMLDPRTTINACMRTIFFVSEFPTFEVVPKRFAPLFNLVTEEDVQRIRESMRPKERTPTEDDGHVRARPELTEEEVARRKTVPCRRFLNGRCRLGERCPYGHIAREDIAPCRSFAKTGRCPRGARCAFKHDVNASPQDNTNKRPRHG